MHKEKEAKPHEPNAMIAIINTMLLLCVYVVLIAFIMTQMGGNPNKDDEDDNNGGGWDNIDDLPPLDLPPGVFVLPPDADDPSLRNISEKDLFCKDHTGN